MQIYIHTISAISIIGGKAKLARLQLIHHPDMPDADATGAGAGGNADAGGSSTALVIWRTACRYTCDQPPASHTSADKGVQAAILREGLTDVLLMFGVRIVALLLAPMSVTVPLAAKSTVMLGPSLVVSTKPCVNW